jgi:shikimate kinase
MVTRDNGDNLVLIGFMGSGKSSVGRELARRLRYHFADTDALIRARYGKSIPEIFAEFGEEEFRQAETEVLEGLVGSAEFVLATGGGIVTRPGNLALLRKLGRVVWLSANEETIWRRVSRNPNRPLLQTEDPRQTIHDLLLLRAPLYRSVADVIVETSGLTHQEVAKHVLHLVPHSRWNPRENDA